MAEIRKTVLDSGWLAARSTEVNLTGIQLTTTQPPAGPSSPWIEAVVPGTVLGTLLKNNLVPYPFYGLNNKMILDIADSGREYYTFWIFTTFHCKLGGNQHVNLNFRAINYSGEVYLNGHKKVLPKVMFRRHSLDVSDTQMEKIYWRFLFILLITMDTFLLKGAKVVIMRLEKMSQLSMLRAGIGWLP